MANAHTIVKTFGGVGVRKNEMNNFVIERYVDVCEHNLFDQPVGMVRAQHSATVQKYTPGCIISSLCSQDEVGGGADNDAHDTK